MSDPVNITQRDGAYEHPFSGLALEFEPLGVRPDRSGFVLHETGYDPANADWNFPSVFSPFWRLYYNSQRGHCVVFGDEFYDLGPDALLLIPDHHLFHCLGQHPTPTFWTHFSCERNLPLKHPVPIVLRPSETELHLIRSLSEHLSGDAEAHRARVFHLSLALLNITLSRSEIEWSAPLPEQVKRLIDFIETQSHRKIPNEALAREAGISVEGVYRLFRTHLGESPANHVNRVRVRKASHLLEQSDYSIDEIAELTGFPNRAYFSRVFKKVTGVTPGSFRA